MVNIKTYKLFFSDKNVWCNSQVFRGIAIPKSQGNRSVLSNVNRCGYFTTICYRNIPYIIRRSDFQAKILKVNTMNYRLKIYMLQVLVRLLKEKLLQNCFTE